MRPAFAQIGDIQFTSIELRPCWRKQPHRSAGAAAAHLRALRRRPNVRGVERLESYRCRHCRFWHVGHVQ